MGLFFTKKNPCCFAQKKTPLASGRRPAAISLPKIDIIRHRIRPRASRDDGELLTEAGGWYGCRYHSLDVRIFSSEEVIEAWKMDRVVFHGVHEIYGISIVYVHIYIYVYNILY